MRAAVRTLTLNLYAIDEPEVQAFLAGPAAAPYFTDLGAYVTDRCQVGHRLLASDKRSSAYGQQCAAAPPAAATLLMAGVLLKRQVCQVGGTAHGLAHNQTEQYSPKAPPDFPHMGNPSDGISCDPQALDKSLASLQGGNPSAARDVEVLLTEVETLLSYWNDILCTGEREAASSAETDLYCLKRASDEEL